MSKKLAKITTKYQVVTGCVNALSSHYAASKSIFKIFLRWRRPKQFWLKNILLVVSLNRARARKWCHKMRVACSKRYSMMADIIHMRQNLLNYHIVVYWREWSVTLVARVLSKLGLAWYRVFVSFDASNSGRSGQKKDTAGNENLRVNDTQLFFVFF